MSVVVDVWAVVARKPAVEDRLSGGIAEWCRGAPNSQWCVDRNLCSVGFMVRSDALDFARSLERRGLRVQEGGAYHDAAIVTSEGAWVHACAWVVVGRYAGVNAAWLTGTDPDPVVVPMRWRESSAQLLCFSDDEAERRLRFVRADDNVEVYEDTETGREVYVGRTRAPAPPDAHAARRLEAAISLVEPYLTSTGLPRRLGLFERRRLRKGIRALEAETAHAGDTPRAWWYLGMARRSAADPEGAYAALKRAYDASPTIDAIGREYAGQCLALGRGQEAVAVSLRNCELHPEDAGLRSNLALALLIAGDVERAHAEVTRARAMQPGDAVTTALLGIIAEVRRGERERPTRFPF